MPLIGTLGALSYNRSGALADWAFTLSAANVYPFFSDLKILNDDLYTCAIDVYPITSFPQDQNTVYLQKTNIEKRPEIVKQNTLIPKTYMRTVVSTNGSTETLFIDPLGPTFSAGFANGTPVRFFGGVFGNITGDTQVYYMLNPSGHSFQVSLGPGGPPVNLSSASGTMYVIAQQADQSNYIEKTNRMTYDSSNDEFLISGTFNSITTSLSGTDGNGYYGTCTFVDSQMDFISNYKNFRSRNPNNQGTDPYMETFDTVPYSNTQYLSVSRGTWNYSNSNIVDIVTTFDATGTINQKYEYSSSNLPNPSMTMLANGFYGNGVVCTNGIARIIDTSTINVTRQLKIDPVMGEIYDVISDNNDDIYIMGNDGNFGFIIKTNDALGEIYQKSYNGLRIKSGYINDGRLFVIGTSTVAEIDISDGSIIWHNNLGIQNVVIPGGSLYLGLQAIVTDQTSMYILANLYTNINQPQNSTLAGVIYKLPNDGTINNSGIYLIRSPQVAYQLVYTNGANQVNTTTYTGNTTVTQFSNLTSTANASVFTNGVINLPGYINRLA